MHSKAFLPTDLHFLVVNDDPNMRHIVVSMLREIGYVKISEAENGEMALRSFKLAQTVGAPINFVITDCAMPFMNGLALVRSIRSQTEMQDLPILMLTAEATKENLLDAANAGVNGYIVRPFKSTVLREKINAIRTKSNASFLS